MLPGRLLLIVSDALGVAPLTKIVDVPLQPSEATFDVTVIASALTPGGLPAPQRRARPARAVTSAKKGSRTVWNMLHPPQGTSWASMPQNSAPGVHVAGGASRA